MESLGRFFRHLFIPHRGNAHRPHILRGGVVTAILAVVMVIQLAAYAEVFLLREGSGSLAGVISSVLVDMTNQARAADNVGSLSINPLLAKAAQAKADDMAAKGYFSHVSPDGRNPWDWIKASGYSYEYAGENLAVNFTDSSDVMSAWMASPEHRANIEKGNYTEIGIATAAGTYEGKSAVFVVQMFASPSLTPSVPVPAGTASKPLIAALHKNAGGEVLAAAASPAAASLAKVSVAEPELPSREVPQFFRALAANPGKVSQVALATALGVFAFALLLALFVRRHLVHKETLRNGALALAVVILGIYLHVSVLSSSGALPVSSLGASVSDSFGN